MAKVIPSPTVIPAAGEPPKKIEEFIGRVNTGTGEISIARMRSPAGWSEPGQKPEFDEYTVVLKGSLHVTLEDEEIDLTEGSTLLVQRGEWVKYSTPAPGGAEYISVCAPAFSPDLVNRDQE